MKKIQVLTSINRTALPLLLNEKLAHLVLGCMSVQYLRKSRSEGSPGKRTPGPLFIYIGGKVYYRPADLDFWLNELTATKFLLNKESSADYSNLSVLNTSGFKGSLHSIAHIDIKTLAPLINEIEAATLLGLSVSMLQKSRSAFYRGIETLVPPFVNVGDLCLYKPIALVEWVDGLAPHRVCTEVKKEERRLFKKKGVETRSVYLFVNNIPQTAQNLIQLP